MLVCGLLVDSVVAIIGYGASKDAFNYYLVV